MPRGRLAHSLRSVVHSDPEIMAVLRNPKMQAVMRDVMARGPEAFQEYAGDEEVMSLLSKLQGRI